MSHIIWDLGKLETGGFCQDIRFHEKKMRSDTAATLEINLT